MRKYFLFLVWIPCFLFSSGDPIVLDQHFSPYAGSYDFLFVERKLTGLQNRYKDYLYHKKEARYEKTSKALNPSLIPPPPTPESSIWNRTLFRSLRLLELSLFWSPLNELAVVTQHEIFGHGYRIRDLGLKKAEVVGYHLDLPFPYGLGGGATYYATEENFSGMDEVLTCIAGTEATSILARNVSLSWLSKNKIDGRETGLFITAHMDLPNYISYQESAKTIVDNYEQGSGDDISAYLISLNLIYPSSVPLQRQLTRLKRRARYSFFAQPFLYYALAAQYKYIWSGQPYTLTESQDPIRFFLPAYRLALSPFGPEDVYEGYLLLKSGDPSYFYFKQGEFSQNQMLGFGFENQGLFKFGSSLVGFKFDFWKQPSLLHHEPENHQVAILSEENGEVTFDHTENGYTRRELYKPHFGAAASLIYRYELQGAKTNTLFTQLGYKTKGFLPGESIHSGLIFRFGMNVLF